MEKQMIQSMMESDIVQREDGTVAVSYSDSTTQLSVPMSGDLAALLAMKETKEIMVHGKPILVNAEEIDSYLGQADSAIHTEEELGELLEQQLSLDDVVTIFNQQLHRKLVGQQFEVSEVGSLSAKATEDLVLVVPQVKLSVHVIEQALDAIAVDDMSKYVTYLPPETEEEKLNPVRCVTGDTLRTFLNEMQEEEGGLDMNSQINIYCKLLTLMPDEDPTKKYSLMQLRAIMQYGDVVSNKHLRLALTNLIEEEVPNA